MKGKGLWSKRRQVKTATSQNGDRNGYSQNGDKPKQHLLYSSSDDKSTVGCTHIWHATVKLYEKGTIFHRNA